MRIHITQRQASLIILFASGTMALFILGLKLAFDYPAPTTEMMLLIALTMYALGVLYARGWDTARIIYIFLSPVVLGLVLPTEAFSHYIAQTILVAPIMAFVMGGTRSILCTALLIWGILAYRSGWQGALISDGTVTFFLIVTALLVSRNILDSSLHSVEAHAQIAKKQAEQLQQNTKLYRALTANMPRSAIMLFDHDLRFVVVDGPEVEAAGYNAPLMIGKTIFETMPPEFVKLAEPNMRAVLAGKRFSAELPHKDQVHTYNYLPLEDEDGNILYGMILAQNITDRYRAETALRENEDSLRQLSDAAVEGIAITSEGNIVLCNRRLAEILGYEYDTLIGKSASQFIAPESAELVSNYASSGYEGVYEHLSVRKDGTIFPVEVQAKNMIYHGQSVRVASIRDVTDRKQAEKELRESEQRYRIISELISDYAFYFNVSENGTLENVWTTEESFTRLTGYTATTPDNLVLTHAPYHPEDVERAMAGIKRTIQGYPTSGEYRIITKYNETKWINLRLRPIWSETDRRVIGLYGAGQDITDRKTAEVALQQNEANYRGAISAAGLVPYVIDYANKRYTFFGDDVLKLTGYSASEITPQIMKSMIREEYLRNVSHADTPEQGRKLILSGTPMEWHNDFRLETRTGELRWISDDSIPILDEHGKASGAIGIMQDISQRKEAEDKIRLMNVELEHRVTARTAQLQAVNEELEGFTYSVSHDLRAPLRAMDGFSRIINENYAADLPEKARYYLERIQINARRMNTLIDDLLALSRLGRKEMHRDTVDMNQLVEKVLADFQSRGTVGSAQITISPLPACYGDASLLEQVLVNLISNALKYSAKMPEPQIIIASQTNTPEVVYTVKDNGAGFDMEYSGKLFGIFQRLHSDNDFEGTGIGLATVKRIITRHDGRVWAEGAVDQGATFYFTIGDQAGSSTLHTREARLPGDYQLERSKETDRANPAG